MATWRYMAACRTSHGRRGWSIREVYDNGRTWTTDDVSAYGDTLAHLQQDLARMLADTKDGVFLDLDTGTVRNVVTNQPYIHPVAADPRYAVVKQLVANGNEGEAQRLEEAIWADVRAKEAGMEKTDG